MVLALAIGAAAGSLAILFALACAAASRAFLDFGAGCRQAAPSGEHAFFAPGTGALRVCVLPAVAPLGDLLAAMVRRAPERSLPARPACMLSTPCGAPPRHAAPAMRRLRGYPSQSWSPSMTSRA
jgi:hypothetical protein